MSNRGSKACPNCNRSISANAETCSGCKDAPTGCLEILNVQGGDVKITYDKSNVAETLRTKRIITDMLRRGYALVVEVDRNGERAYERVQRFDAEKGEYIIADFDSLEAAKVDSQQPQPPSEVASPGPVLKPRRGRPPTKRLPIEKTKATGIGRSAGG